jgi:hypothetical protein
MRKLCYNLTEIEQLASYQQYERGTYLKRAVLLLVSTACLVGIVSCGSSNNSVTGPNGNATVNAPSMLKNRAFITNQYSGNIQIVDSQTDATAYYTVTNNNTGVTGPGVTGTAVSITVGGSLTFEVLSPDGTETLVYNPSNFSLTFITNSTESLNGSVSLANWADMVLYSPDSTKVFAPVPNAPITNGRAGGVQVIDTSTGSITSTYPVPQAHGVSISPNGNTLLVFALNSDTMYLIDLTQTSPTAVAIPGFARPVNAFFSSDNSTAYVINCGPECGSTAGPPSVMSFNVASQSITATVPVGGASVGLMKSNNVYVAGYPGGSNGTFDIVDVSSMTRTTPNPVAIGDGSHTTMAISNNNKMYIGAVTCANVTSGCLSIVDLGTTKTNPTTGPLGGVTGVQSIPNRNVMYVVEGGVLYMYDTTTGMLQSTQLAFRGALYGVLQVDP